MKPYLLILLMFWSGMATAAEAVKVWSVQADLGSAYTAVYTSLEENRFFVVFEPNIGNNLARFADRWGEDYNRNGLAGIRSLVFCNAWYANQVSNQDPNMLALCPLHMTLIQQGDETRVLFIRPSVVANGSGAESVARELEQAVAKAVEQGLATLSPR